MRERWEKEKNAIGDSAELKERIERANSDIDRVVREADLTRAGQLRHGRYPS